MSAECAYHGPTVPKPREQDERRGLGPGSREWWERYRTDDLERLKRYLETVRKMQDPTAIAIARAHIDAWSHHDWDKTRELLASNVRVLVTSTQPEFGSGEYRGIDAYMEPKIRAAQLIEPGSVRELSAIGDETNALILVTMRIGLGPGGTMMTLARACLYPGLRRVP